MWLSATKEVPMKDYKPKVITVTNNIRATIYPNGDFDISFLYSENRRWDFEFSKFNRIKQRTCIDGRAYKPLTDPHFNWLALKECLKDIEREEEVPAWIKALARWRFDKPTRYKMVEEQIGCVLFFRKEEY
jgi:hypothetical protein